jgi:hypothetical protein
MAYYDHACMKGKTAAGFTQRTKELKHRLSKWKKEEERTIVNISILQKYRNINIKKNQ